MRVFKLVLKKTSESYQTSMKSLYISVEAFYYHPTYDILSDGMNKDYMFHLQKG